MSQQSSLTQAMGHSDLQTGIAEFRASFRGEVMTADDERYEAARRVWNAMIDRRPAVIVRARGVADVIAAVGFAHDHALAISIRSGGHNVAGHAIGDGSMMIDLSAMRAVQVDPLRRRAWVEGGATWRDVDRETQAFGLATPGGLISDTGVAGLTLSGGIGWLRSRYGLTVDNLVAADVVIADGRLMHASPKENTDLLWALKGGGGNFGVITNFEFELHPFGLEVMFCAPIYPIEYAGRAIRVWRDFLADKNGVVGSLAEFSTVAEGPDFPQETWGKRVVTLAAVYAGDARDGETLMRPLREIGGVVTDFSSRMKYCDVQQLFDALMPFGQYRCYWKCHYLNDLSDAVIDKIVDGNHHPPSPNTLSSIWNFGGATAALPAHATAFGDRSMPYMFSIDSVWRSPDDDAANINWTREFWQRMRAHSHQGRLYLNFPGLGEEGEDLVKCAFGENYSRLVATKQKYDPQNLFRFNQNIRPAS
jgi:FAD/FMN-containing dehydrogenase